MTIHQERIWAVIKTRKFLDKLWKMKKSEINKMPIKELREEIYRCLKHYPFDFEIEKWEETRNDSQG